MSKDMLGSSPGYKFVGKTFNVTFNDGVFICSVMHDDIMFASEHTCCSYAFRDLLYSIRTRHLELSVIDDVLLSNLGRKHKQAALELFQFFKC
jgi:hypothetical protein